MTKEIWSEDGLRFIRVVEATPVCGKDCCDECGDCLACHWEDECPYTPDGKHRWVQYGEEEAGGTVHHRVA